MFESPSLRATTRRHFFRDCAVGLGKVGLASLLTERAARAAAAGTSRATHFAPKAKRVIYLFMAGGPSQLDLFDYKPKLNELEGKPIPPSIIAGKRFAFMDTFNKEPPKLLGTT